MFMETKSETASMYVSDTASNQVVETIGGYCCSEGTITLSMRCTSSDRLDGQNVRPGGDQILIGHRPVALGKA
jgi:hypothetical protein